MQIATAKKYAERHGLELYYDRQWKVWGLIDPKLMINEESLWLSPNQLKSMDLTTWVIHYCEVMAERIKNAEENRNASCI